MSGSVQEDADQDEGEVKGADQEEGEIKGADVQVKSQEDIAAPSEANEDNAATTGSKGSADGIEEQNEEAGAEENVEKAGPEEDSVDASIGKGDMDVPNADEEHDEGPTEVVSEDEKDQQEGDCSRLDEGKVQFYLELIVLSGELSEGSFGFEFEGEMGLEEGLSQFEEEEEEGGVFKGRIEEAEEITDIYKSVDEGEAEELGPSELEFEGAEESTLAYG